MSAMRSSTNGAPAEVRTLNERLFPHFFPKWMGLTPEMFLCSLPQTGPTCWIQPWYGRDALMTKLKLSDRTKMPLARFSKLTSGRQNFMEKLLRRRWPNSQPESFCPKSTDCVNLCSADRERERQNDSRLRTSQTA